MTAVVAVALLLAAPVAAGTMDESAPETKPPWTKNCTALNNKYPHGLGKAKARDKTSAEPVTNFKRNTRLYNLAMSYNKGLDRDRDGVACEND
jgi:excalibur calcium-binding domain-containing protein